MKKVLVVLGDGFEEVEAFAPVTILRRAGLAVTVAGLDSQEVKGARSVTVLADAVLDDVKGDSFDAIVLPGGMPGAANLAASSLLNGIVEHMARHGKIVSAICASPAVVLAPLGLLDNKKATCYPGAETNLNDSTNYVDKDVVLDGNVITAKAASTAVKFGLKVLEELIGKEEADRVAESICF